MAGRNIPQELRNGVNNLNSAEELGGTADALLTVDEIVDTVSQTLATMSSSTIPDSTAPIEIKLILALTAGICQPIGKVIRWNDEKTLASVFEKFGILDEFETDSGEWKVFSENKDDPENSRFLATYSRNKVIITLVSGEKFDQYHLRTTLQQLTQQTLEPKKGVHWPTYPPNVDNAEIYGLVQGLKLSILALLADLGLPNLLETYPGLLYTFHHWLNQNNYSQFLGYSALIGPLFILFIISSTSLGRHLGLKRDMKISQELPGGAKDYNYGKLALRPHDNGILKNIIYSAVGSARNSLRRIFGGRKDKKTSE